MAVKWVAVGPEPRPAAMILSHDARFATIQTLCGGADDGGPSHGLRSPLAGTLGFYSRLILGRFGLVGPAGSWISYSLELVTSFLNFVNSRRVSPRLKNDCRDGCQDLMLKPTECREFRVMRSPAPRARHLSADPQLLLAPRLWPSTASTHRLSTIRRTGRTKTHCHTNHVRRCRVKDVI